MFNEEAHEAPDIVILSPLLQEATPIEDYGRLEGCSICVKV
jgi:hypothetical protein